MAARVSAPGSAALGDRAGPARGWVPCRGLARCGLRPLCSGATNMLATSQHSTWCLHAAASTARNGAASAPSTRVEPALLSARRLSGSCSAAAAPASPQRASPQRASPQPHSSSPSDWREAARRPKTPKAGRPPAPKRPPEHSRGAGSFLRHAPSSSSAPAGPPRAATAQGKRLQRRAGAGRERASAHAARRPRPRAQQPHSAAASYQCAPAAALVSPPGALTCCGSGSCRGWGCACGPSTGSCRGSCCGCGCASAAGCASGCGRGSRRRRRRSRGRGHSRRRRRSCGRDERQPGHSDGRWALVVIATLEGRGKPRGRQCNAQDTK